VFYIREHDVSSLTPLGVERKPKLSGRDQRSFAIGLRSMGRHEGRKLAKGLLRHLNVLVQR
jgi:hypothetical protein